MSCEMGIQKSLEFNTLSLHPVVCRGGSWELAGSFVGGPIDGLGGGGGGGGAWEPAQADPSKLPITLHTGPCICNV